MKRITDREAIHALQPHDRDAISPRRFTKVTRPWGEIHCGTLDGIRLKT